MKVSKTVMRHVVSVLSLALVFASVPLHAGSPTAEELRHEAFVRGGNAITEALNAKTEAAPALHSFGEAIPPAAPPAPAPAPQSSGSGMNKLVWAGLIGGFAVSGILIYHFATGPGASVRNCSTCK